MLSKVAGLARLVNIVLAIVAGLIAIPGIDVTVVLIVIGLIAGINSKREDLTNLLIAAVTLPAVGGVLANLPSVGGYLGDIFTNFGLAVAGHAAMAVVLTVYGLVMSEVKGLTGSAS